MNVRKAARKLRDYLLTAAGAILCALLMVVCLVLSGLTFDRGVPS